MLESKVDILMNNQVEPTGSNPHYKPPIMRWNEVLILGIKGLQFGVISDNGGSLVLSVRLSGGKWPADHIPDPNTVVTLIDPQLIYKVINNDRGPAVGHEYDPGSDGKCKICDQ